MRDIHPDEAYEVLGIDVLCASQIGTGIVHYIAFAKNSSGEEALAAAEALNSKVGPFTHFEPETEKAAGVSHYASQMRWFQEPIPFDEDDQLNVWIYQGGANVSTYVFTIFYRLL